MNSKKETALKWLWTVISYIVEGYWVLLMGAWGLLLIWII